MTALTHETVYRTIAEIFEDLADDLDADVVALTPDTRLVDLGLESISLVYLISELQQHFALEDRLFHKLRSEGLLLKEMTVRDVAGAAVAIAGEANVGKTHAGA